MMASAKGPRLLLVLLTAALAQVLAQYDVAILEAPSAEAVQRGKAALDKWNAQAASERGLMNVLLGNSCFTTAITALHKECSQLSTDQRCWLAIQFSMCFQRVSGFKVLDCPSVCPRRRALKSCVEECTGRMDDRQQSTYTTFFGDVMNMCLFLQTQQFQEVTAQLVTDMHASSVAVNTSLGSIRTDLQSQSQALSQSLTALGQLQAVQSEVQVAVQAGLREVKEVGHMAEGLQHSMNTSINMTGALSSRHEQLMQGFTELEAAHQQHAARAREAFDQLAQEAAALEQRQARYEALQSRLLNASESLLDQSQGMSDLLTVLMNYQAKGNTILSQLQGSSVSLQDVLFYTASLTVPLLFITYPSDVRLLLLGGILACWGVERAVLQHYVMLFGPMHSSQAGTAAGSGSGFMASQDVKVAVRLLMLGGTLGVVLWLLMKRRVAHNRRETAFQAIQLYLQQAQQPPAPTTYAAFPPDRSNVNPAAGNTSTHLAPHTPQAALTAAAAAPQTGRTPANAAAERGAAHPSDAMLLYADPPAGVARAALSAAQQHQHQVLHQLLLQQAVQQGHAQQQLHSLPSSRSRLHLLPSAPPAPHPALPPDLHHMMSHLVRGGTTGPAEPLTQHFNNTKLTQQQQSLLLQQQQQQVQLHAPQAAAASGVNPSGTVTAGGSEGAPESTSDTTPGTASGQGATGMKGRGNKRAAAGAPAAPAAPRTKKPVARQSGRKRSAAAAAAVCDDDGGGGGGVNAMDVCGLSNAGAQDGTAEPPAPKKGSAGRGAKRAK